MTLTGKFVKLAGVSAIVVAAFAAFAAVAAMPVAAAEAAAGTPHMMYFYNPSCRLCTSTNEVVGAVEEKYKDRMSSQRFDIADEATGTDNVLYMFYLLDELQVPDDGNITLIVFLGTVAEENGEYFFTPERVLVEGDEIIEKLDGEVTDFLAGAGKGVSLGNAARRGFFLERGLRFGSFGG